MIRFLVLMICLTVLAATGCKPDSDVPCRNPYIDPIEFYSDDLAKIPFSGKGDSLYYVGATGDSLLCVGADKTTSYTTFPVKNNPECADDSIGYLIYQFTYADSLNKLRFSATAYNYDTLLTIAVNNSLFKLPFYTIGVNDSLTYFDSLSFGNKMFYQVKAYINDHPGDSLYYNTTYGMVAVKQGSQRFYIYRFNNK
jgi:hypothetical protein